jgi:hypothetical protein
MAYGTGASGNRAEPVTGRARATAPRHAHTPEAADV